MAGDKTFTDRGETFTTRHVAEMLGVKQKTIQYWAREGLLTPHVEGEGKQRRFYWTPADVDEARGLRDANGQVGMIKIVADMVGPDFLRSVNHAQSIAETASKGEIIAAGGNRALRFRADTPLGDVVRRLDGVVILFPRS